MICRVQLQKGDHVARWFEIWIEAIPDSFLETVYEVTDSDIRSRAKPAYQYTLDNNG